MSRNKQRARRDRIEQRNPPGSSPGTLSVDPGAPRPQMRVIAYGPDSLAEKIIETPDAVREYLGHWQVTSLTKPGCICATATTTRCR